MADDPVEKFLAALEEMIDAADDMWEEEKYSNYRELQKIKDNRYLPAKELAKSTLLEAMKTIAEQNKCSCSCGSAPLNSYTGSFYHDGKQLQ